MQQKLQAIRLFEVGGFGQQLNRNGVGHKMKPKKETNLVDAPQTLWLSCLQWKF